MFSTQQINIRQNNLEKKVFTYPNCFDGNITSRVLYVC